MPSSLAVAQPARLPPVRMTFWGHAHPPKAHLSWGTAPGARSDKRLFGPRRALMVRMELMVFNDAKISMVGPIPMRMAAPCACLTWTSYSPARRSAPYTEVAAWWECRAPTLQEELRRGWAGRGLLAARRETCVQTAATDHSFDRVLHQRRAPARRRSERSASRRVPAHGQIGADACRSGLIRRRRRTRGGHAAESDERGSTPRGKIGLPVRADECVRSGHTTGVAGHDAALVPWSRSSRKAAQTYTVHEARTARIWSRAPSHVFSGVTACHVG